MSKAWRARQGSTTRWRTMRRHILQRDQWVCGICHTPIPATATHPHRLAPEVHHLDGAQAGDDPLRLQAAHRICNLREGSPTPPGRAGDKRSAQPKRMTSWGGNRKQNGRKDSRK